VYMIVGIIPIFLHDIDPIWWNWGIVACCVGFMQFVINIRYNPPPTTIRRNYNEYVNMHPMLTSVVICTILLGLIAVPVARIINKNHISVHDIPSLQNTSMSWCVVSCPITNNITSSCNAFNQMMLNVGTTVDLTLPECLDRSIKICENPVNSSIECANAWASFNYALVNNDGNTEPINRTIVNLFYGFLINVATVLFYWVFFYILFYYLDKNQNCSNETQTTFNISPISPPLDS